MPKAKLYIKPLGGLCNRMRSILAAMQLAQETARNLHVVWERKAELNAPFEVLFKPCESFEVINTSALWLPSVYEKVRQDHFYSFNPDKGWRLPSFFPKPYQQGIYNDDFANIADRLYQKQQFAHFSSFRHSFIEKVAEQWNTLMHSESDIYISSFYEFYPNEGLEAAFQPTDYLQEKIENLARQFGEITYGLHIRRGDHQQAIEKSPLAAFITLMEQELIQKPQLTFFLATDSNEVEVSLKAKFKDKIITRPKHLSRKSIQGMQDAVIDLFALSRTQKVFGSYWSSFSEMSARIGNISEVSVTNIY